MAVQMIQVSVRPNPQRLIFAVVVDKSLSFAETSDWIHEQALKHLRENVELGSVSIRELPDPDANTRADNDLPIP